MDIISAKEAAKAQSESEATRVYVYIDEQMEAQTTTTMPEEFQHVYFKGKELNAVEGASFDTLTKSFLINPTTTAQNKAARKTTPTTKKQISKTSKSTTMKKSAKKAVKKVAPAKKAAAPKKEKGPKLVVRGNNMFLSEADWKKVDAKRGDTSFAAWSKSLVKKAAGIAD